uniref:Uncharacterized protein n=1 Tax=Anopheles culicifacies TaxID=139723 RepID=A0A182LYN1_9DIPT
MFSEPVHFPLVIGNETLVLTVQDQRNIIDRRNWFLSRPPNPPQVATVPPLVEDNVPINLYPLIARILLELQAKDAAFQLHSFPTQQMKCGQEQPFCFHYAKQTDTDDLPYYQNYDRLTHGQKVVKHVHYFVESAVKSTSTNTDTSSVGMETEEITDIEDITM